MSTVTFEDMQRDLTGLLDRVQAGETLVVVRADKPVAEIKPVSAPDGGMAAKQPRPFGLAAGQLLVPADFDEPLPEDILSAFENK